MKVFLAVSKRYARHVIETLSLVALRPRILVASYDDEVEILAKAQGHEFVKLKDVEKLYTIEKLEEFDIAIAALDDDVQNVAVARVAKSMGIPVIVAIIHNELNRDAALGEGVQGVISIERFVSGNLKLLLMPDTWIVMELSIAPSLAVAIQRIVKRSVLGIGVKDLLEVAKLSKVRVIAVDKVGNIVDEDRPLENGDSLVVIGSEPNVLKAVAELEKVFRRYEQLYVIRYPEPHRLGGYG